MKIGPRLTLGFLAGAIIIGPTSLFGLTSICESFSAIVGVDKPKIKTGLEMEINAKGDRDID